MQEKAAVVIVAAGASRRMGRDKLWIPIAHRPVLARTIDAFQSSSLIDTIVIVTSQDKYVEVVELCAHETWNKVYTIVIGGARRQDSVRLGLDALAQSDKDCQWVMVHDGARPFVTETIIAAGLQAATEHQAAVAAVPVKDTIKQVIDGIILATPDRSQLWNIQTPQVFAFNLIHQAHHSALAQDDATDDAILMERLGYHVAIFPGSYTNIKITTQDDLLIANALLQEQHL
jgi:2-C-methyl-D-erythritol 4-phosphate cytidylyltransferase